MPDESGPPTLGIQAGSPKTNLEPEEQRAFRYEALSSPQFYRPPSELALRWITVGGMLFLALAAGAFSIAVVLLYYLSIHGSAAMRVDPLQSTLVQQIFGFYLAPALTFLVGLVTAGIGSMLLRVAGTFDTGRYSQTRPCLAKPAHSGWQYCWNR